MSFSEPGSTFTLPLPQKNVREAALRRNSIASRAPENPSLWFRAREHLTAPVRASAFAEVELILLTFSTGIQGQFRRRLPDDLSDTLGTERTGC